MCLHPESGAGCRHWQETGQQADTAQHLHPGPLGRRNSPKPTGPHGRRGLNAEERWAPRGQWSQHPHHPSPMHLVHSKTYDHHLKAPEHLQPRKQHNDCKMHDPRLKARSVRKNVDNPVLGEIIQINTMSPQHKAEVVHRSLIARNCHTQSCTVVGPSKARAIRKYDEHRTACDAQAARSQG